LDPREVAQFLGGAADVEPIRHGEWSKTFRLRRGDRDYVVRFRATVDDFLKDQRVFRLASARLPMPLIVDIGIGEAFGGYYAISERAYDDFLEDRDEQSLSTPELAAVQSLGLHSTITPG
jgi:hypothetical protein